MTNTVKNTNETPNGLLSNGRGTVLLLLVLVYTFNFLDRQILAILAPDIQKEMNLDDGALGLLLGFPFALFYAIMGLPVAYIADRKDRTWIMTIALTIWSAMTAACGFAQNLVQLSIARMLVGVGEAGGVAPAYSLLSDYFPKEQRARALAIYSFGIPIGSAIGIIFGAVIATLSNWRIAFVVVGLMGVLLAPIFKLLIKEPVRGGYDAPNTGVKNPSISQVIKTLITKPSFWTLAIGASFSSMMGYGLFAWLPAFFVRSYGDVLPQFMSWVPDFLVPAKAGAKLFAGYYYGSVVLIGGIIGIFLGGIVSDKMGAANKSAYALVPAIAFTIAIPFFFIGIFTKSLAVTFFVMLIPTALSLVWLGPVLAAFQHIVKPNMRATASALFLLINNLIGIGLGTYVIGLISKNLAPIYGTESLRYSIMYGTVFYAVAAILMFVSAKLLPKDWEE
jgi:MFS family permease